MRQQQQNTIYKKSLKIPKGQSETEYRRRTDNTMAWLGQMYSNNIINKFLSLMRNENNKKHKKYKNI